MTVRESYERVDEWLREHPVGWFVVTVLVTWFVYAGSWLVLSDDSIPVALVLGAVFAVVYATITTLAR